jgi:hypothetical protein
MKDKTIKLLLIFCLATLCTIGWSVHGQRQVSSTPSQKQASSMVAQVTWEYTLALVPYNESGKLISVLNTYGAQGWEVVHAEYPRDDSHAFSFILKRPK